MISATYMARVRYKIFLVDRVTDSDLVVTVKPGFAILFHVFVSFGGYPAVINVAQDKKHGQMVDRFG